MKRFLIFLIFMLMISATAWGKDIALSPSLGAKAYLLDGEAYGFAEKTLVVQFSESRRVLSTADGFVEAKAMINSSAEPALWREVCRELKTGTDGIILVTGAAGPKVTYAGGHSRIGELIGKAAYEAVVQALEKQNGFTLKP